MVGVRVRAGRVRFRVRVWVRVRVRVWVRVRVGLRVDVGLQYLGDNADPASTVVTLTVFPRMQHLCPQMWRC